MNVLYRNAHGFGPSWYGHRIGVTEFCTNNRGNLLPNLWALWGYEVTPLLFLCRHNVLLWSLLASSYLSIL